MSVYTKESISDLLFQKIDSIIIVDAEKDTYQTVKKQGLFETFVENEGSYKSLVEKLWFNLNGSPKKITDDYHVFIPMMGKFKGKYVDRVNLNIDEKTHLVQISIYPIDESCTKYVFILDELDNSEYLRDFLTDRKIDTIQNTFLFSMYVDLIKDISYSINITEISNNPQNYDVKYTTWRQMIVNMIWPDDQKLFLERTDPEYLKKNLEPGRATSFDCQMKNLEGVFIWVKLIFTVSINEALAKSYYDTLTQLSQSLGNPVNSDIFLQALRMPDVISTPQEELSDELWANVPCKWRI